MTHLTSKTTTFSTTSSFKQVKNSLSSALKVPVLGLAALVLFVAPFTVNANPNNETLSIYNQAAQGDEDLVDVAYEQLNATLEKEGATPLTLVYLGSTETLMGRDAFLPWNKMKFVEKGLATIDKSLHLLSDFETPIHEQERIQGLPESYLTRAMAAVTYSSLPDMFNHFERGYDLFIALLAEDNFRQQHFAATSWVYRYAIEAAIRAEDMKQAKEWLAEMETQDDSNIETMTAKALVEKAVSQS
ncbi:hypothetical protein ACFFUS_07450 [Vibrio gallaecicus]|uniref:hypothetical protein n=1 Tax=Vibrio gallaecicus TaxID=552386 RepID=UPI001F10EFB7|nr:hypothetical protein [Vibrio gallaecicus]MDN3616200.1 hypothetical protein [Vibrio gallaecicus]